MLRSLALAAALALGSAVAAPAQDGWKREGTTLRHGKDFSITPTGYVQEDFRSFQDGWGEGDADSGSLVFDSRETRRLRGGFAMDWKRLTLQLSVDVHQDADHLKDLYGELKLDRAFRLRVGHFKVPVSPEWMTSASRTDFMERSLLADSLAPARDWGVMARGELGKRVEYNLGVFQGDDRVGVSRAQTTVAGHVVVKLADDLEAGTSYSQGDVEAQEEGGTAEPMPKGFIGRGPSGYLFYRRHFVNGRRQRLGFDLSLTPGPVGLKGEWLRGREQRLGQGATFDDLPDEVGTGWAVTATWLLTGESKNGRVRPRRPLFGGGPGAIEISARYEEIRFDDDGPDEGFEGAGNRARNIRPAGDRVLWGGVSWWPREWLRFMGDVAVERFLDPLLAPELGRQGNYVTLLGRIQLQVP